MSIMDRAIAAISPSWALRRAVSRVQLREAEAINRRHAMRQQQRFRDNWAINSSADRAPAVADGRRALTPIDRARLRRLFRLNPFARKMKAALLNNLVGYGITATPKGTKKLQDDWKAWIPLADFDGVQDLYGLQELAVWTMLLDGECFVVRRLVKGTANPLRIQILKVDQLDCTVASARVRDGVEYGADGRPAAYWFKRALDDLFGIAGTGSSERISAEDVIHMFRREEPGQWRGWSHFEAIVEAITDVDDYIEAEGVRKKIESCFTAFVSRDVNADQDGRSIGDEVAGHGAGTAADGAPARVEGFYPGQISYLDQGETVVFGEPKAAGGFSEYLRWGALRIAAGAEVTYEGLTGDLSQVNFSSYRAGANEFESGCGRLQWLTIIPQFCEGVVGWWRQAGYDTGRIGPRDQKAVFKHTPPRVKTIDRAGDAKAAVLEMAAGIESRRNHIAERGNDHDQLMDEIAADLAANQRRKIAFQGDPKTIGAKNADSSGGSSASGTDDDAGGGDTTGVV